jgi:hypothetical protein
LTLPGIIEEPGCSAGSTSGGVPPALGLEVVGGLPIFQAGRLRDVRDRPGWKAGRAVEAGPHGGAPESQLREAIAGRLDPRDAQLDLARVSGELLADAHRRRIHQVGAADLHRIVQLRRLARQTCLQLPQGGQQVLVEGLTGGDVERRGHHVVGRLAVVDVVVGVDRVPAGPAQLAGPARDHLVGVHVCRGARAGLEDVDDEVVVQAAIRHLPGGGPDVAGDPGIERAELGVRCRRRLLDDSQRPDEVPGKALAAHRKVQHGALRGRAPEGLGGHLHLAHGVALDPRLRGPVRHDRAPSPGRACGSAHAPGSRGKFARHRALGQHARFCPPLRAVGDGARSVRQGSSPTAHYETSRRPGSGL